MAHILLNKHGILPHEIADISDDEVAFILGSLHYHAEEEAKLYNT